MESLTHMPAILYETDPHREFSVFQDMEIRNKLDGLLSSVSVCDCTDQPDRFGYFDFEGNRIRYFVGLDEYKRPTILFSPSEV